MAVDDPLARDEELTCGRLLSQVWDQALDPAPADDPHTMTCPFCGEAIASLATLKAATRTLRGRAPAHLQALIRRVMSAVKAEARLGRMLPLADPDRDLRIAESAAATVLRRAADDVPGVQAAACRLTPADDDDGTKRVVVTLTLAAGLDRPLPDRIDEVRRSVLHAAEHTIGLQVTAVDITVTDLLDPSPSPGPTESGPHTPGGT
ncbi:hypothetical protein SAMN05428944_0053 [Streptomyces sp. 1222.5]|uniref:Asp23/Gls24 family envelope stress response protein n=1 Tax=unclassified Streptomyces TaxID=2593676 RepID=UPI00089C0B2B|nr:MULTISPECIES: Asp23/Gls24 family envelope stress response protein [unclassified Streptomyces]PKW04991.1 hypothetical protein BX260_0050 [Streptomyces sp. 5112.2]SEB52933.1 hypothetical protein SAMN05428944_0053 [Streptomyces sp. 1222.5]